ncbi:hypothetical protein FKM82_008748 [Ascaphus truei]
MYPTSYTATHLFSFHDISIHLLKSTSLCFSFGSSSLYTNPNHMYTNPDKKRSLLSTVRMSLYCVGRRNTRYFGSNMQNNFIVF